MNALGPVIANRFADERKTQLKPHLLQRLDEQVMRAVALGTVVTGEDGKLAFVPNYTHTSTSTAQKAAPTQPAEGDDEREAMVGFDPKTSPLQVGDRVRKIKGATNLNCTGVVDQPLNGDPRRPGCFHVAWDNNPTGDNGWWGERGNWEIVSRGEADPAALTFDPMTEPLQVGDEIEVVYRATQHAGKRDIVTAVRADGGCDCKDTGSWGYRTSLKLIRKADPARKPS